MSYFEVQKRENKVQRTFFAHPVKFVFLHVADFASTMAICSMVGYGCV
jgi:hypothetical protein